MTLKPVPTRATFTIRGLRTPENAIQLERHLEGCTGVLHAEVRLKSQNAKIEFDERIISAQAVARCITEQFMSEHSEPLAASIFLKVPSIRNKATAQLPVHILHKVRGVESVMLRLGLQAVEVRLMLNGDLTTQDLIRALAVEGIVSNVI